MLWICPHCGAHNLESSSYCPNCGMYKLDDIENGASCEEEKDKEKKLVTSSSSSEQNSSEVQLSTNYEQKFNHILKKIEFPQLMRCGKGLYRKAVYWYVATAILFLFALMALGEGTTSFIIFIVLGMITLGIGSFLKLLSEIILLFLQGEKELYLSAKYNYATTELTEELIKKIDLMESKLTTLWNKDLNSKE